MASYWEGYHPKHLLVKKKQYAISFWIGWFSQARDFWLGSAVAVFRMSVLTICSLEAEPCHNCPFHPFLTPCGTAPRSCPQRDPGDPRLEGPQEDERPRCRGHSAMRRRNRRQHVLQKKHEVLCFHRWQEEVHLMISLYLSLVASGTSHKTSATGQRRIFGAKLRNC